MSLSVRLQQNKVFGTQRLPALQTLARSQNNTPISATGQDTVHLRFGAQESKKERMGRFKDTLMALPPAPSMDETIVQMMGVMKEIEKDIPAEVK